MQSPNFRAILRRLPRHSSHLNWLGVIILAFVFVMFALPTGARSATNTAGFAYLHNADGGWLSDLSNAMLYEIVGSPEPVVADAGNVNGSSTRPGALQTLGNFTGAIYNSPPASIEYWAEDAYATVERNLDISAAAQDVGDPSSTSIYFPGLGTQLLSPMLGFWQWSRNIVYGFMILIFVVLAFMILFMQTGGGKSAVTLFNSIPNILLTIAAVTFSYPIIGLSVDLIFIGSNLTQSIIFTAPGAPGQPLATGDFILQPGEEDVFPGNDLNYLQPDDQAMSIWTVWGATGATVCPDAADGEDCSISGIIPDFSGGEGSLLGNVGAIVSRVIGQSADDIVNTELGNGLIELILAVTALTASFKLFMALLNNYVTLLLAPVYAPFMLFAGILPGKSGGSIMGLIKMLLASSLSFVAVAALFQFLIVFGHSESLDGAFQGASSIRWTPPLLGYSQEQTLLAGSESIIRSLVVFVAFVASPQIPDMVKKAFSVQAGGPSIVAQAGQSVVSTGKTLFGVGQSIRGMMPG